MLFLAAKVGQMTGVDPEEALHAACGKFARRFRTVEESASAPLDRLSVEELRDLWGNAKKRKPS